MQPQDDNIFQEVNQSLREETIAKAWKRWQWVVYGAVALAIGGVAAWEIMRAQRAGEIAAAAKVFDAAFAAGEAGDLPTARARLVELQNNKTGFAALAGHMLADVERDLTDDPALIETHLRAAADADKTGVLADLAILKLAYIKADAAPSSELEELLQPVIARDTTASRLANELIAAKLIAEGKPDRARDILEALRLDPESPQAMLQRVNWALQSLPARQVNLDAPSNPSPASQTPSSAPASPAQPQQAP